MEKVLFFERVLTFYLWVFMAIALAVLNHRLSKMQGPFDLGDQAARYGLSIERLFMAAAVLMAAYDVGQNFRVLLLFMASVVVSLGLARDLWFPKDRSK